MEQSFDFERLQGRALRRKRILRLLTYLLLGVWAVVVLFPFYWMLLTSVKDYGSYNAEHIPTFFTLSPTLQNYRDAFTSVPLGRYLLNTVFFAVVTTALMVVVITLSAYAFARMEFRGKNLLFTLFLSLMMIPTELVVITNYATITGLELLEPEQGKQAQTTLENQNKLNGLVAFTTALQECGLMEGVTSIDVSSNTEIVMVYDGRLTVKVLNDVDFDRKLKALKQIIAIAGDTGRGTINMKGTDDIIWSKEG